MSLSAKTSKGDLFTHYITLDRDFVSLANLQGIIGDPHFVTRDRMGRDLAFMCRIYLNGWSNTPRDIAIDERTALLIDSRPALEQGMTAITTAHVQRTHRCGVYRNIVSTLIDQQGGTILGGDFTFTESFSNYSTTLSPNPGPPPTQSSTQNTLIQVLADTQFFGFVAPSVPHRTTTNPLISHLGLQSVLPTSRSVRSIISSGENILERTKSM